MAPLSPRLTQEHERIIESAFEAFDLSDDAFIDDKEMCKALESIDPGATKAEIKLLVDSIDESGDGKVELWEFRKFLERKLLGTSDEDEMMHKFEAVFDQSKLGLVTPHELRQLLMKEGAHPLSEAEANELIELAQTMGDKCDSDGLIEYRPFLAWLKNPAA
jgi:Ca2+-binding EF-hand superfamily protein